MDDDRCFLQNDSRFTTVTLLTKRTRVSVNPVLCCHTMTTCSHYITPVPSAVRILGYLCANNLHTLVAADLDASQKSRDGV